MDPHKNRKGEGIILNEDLPEKLQRIETKLDSLKKMLQQYTFSVTSETETSSAEAFVLYPAQKSAASLDPTQISVYLLRLPDSLRKTMLAMNWLREATTRQVAKITGRTRSVESFHLNQLERMGYLIKHRWGRKVYFKVPKPVEAKGRKISEAKR